MLVLYLLLYLQYYLFFQVVQNLTSPGFAEHIRSRISDGRTYDIWHYDPVYANRPESGTTHLSLYGPGGSAVAATSTVNGVWVIVFIDFIWLLILLL